jgi:ketosteroid isomerase-like protein
MHKVVRPKLAPSSPPLEPFLAAYHQACEQFIRGNPKPMKHLYTKRGDVTLFYPWGGPALKGHGCLEEGMERSAATFKEGRFTQVERTTQYVTAELALLVEVWRFEARVGGTAEPVPGALRVTQVLRPEAGGWRILHRHADPMVDDVLLSAPASAGS